jgi:hypothetical protein
VDLTLADIPALSGPRPPGTERIKRRRPTAPRQGRRAFLKATLATGMGLGVASLGFLPPARRADAETFFNIKPLPCPGYAMGHNCSPGCGSSPLCFRCCRYPNEGDGCTRPGWHKGPDWNGGNNEYRLRPDACVSGTDFDGWKWRFGDACGCCRSWVMYRCHDGRLNVNGNWVPRICRSTLICFTCGSPC